MKRPLGIVLLACYLLATGAAGPIVTGILLLHALRLEYVNGFVIVALVLMMIDIVPAVLSLIAGYRVWVRHPHATRLIRWALGTRIVLSLFPPGFTGPLGVGFLAVPFDAAILVYACTRGVSAYFAARLAPTS